MEIATETAVPTNGTRPRGWPTGRGHSPESRKKMSETKKAKSAQRKIDARKAEANRKRSEAAKANWARKMAIAETSGADPLAFSAIERALSATADPGAVTFSMPLAFVLATLSTADLLAELGRRANP
jgi:hypothetical protein